MRPIRHVDYVVAYLLRIFGCQVQGSNGGAIVFRRRFNPYLRASFFIMGWKKGRVMTKDDYDDDGGEGIPTGSERSRKWVPERVGLSDLCIVSPILCIGVPTWTFPLFQGRLQICEACQQMYNESFDLGNDGTTR